MILEQIKGPEELKQLSSRELAILAEEIRTFLIEKISRTGGHLASNLGVVELTIALFKTFDLPQDKIIWDVGHQSYTHKILSGRMAEFDELRQYGGISGFPKRKESPYDSFDTGHSSTSISAGLIAQGRDLLGEDYRVVSVIGDGALTGGMAYEALNNAARMKKNFIIILNDNEMSISENVGGMSRYLSGLRTGTGYNDLKKNIVEALERVPLVGNAVIDKLKRTKDSIKQLFIPGMLFENMGLTYLGPVDGHDMRQLGKVLQEAKRKQGPVLIHVLTEKGRGYEPAMRHPARFHGAAPYEIETGLPKSKGNPSYTDIFSTVMRKLGDRDEKVVAVTAAMTDGTGLKRFHNMFPERFFDVGIAEQHAVTFAAGLAAAGLKPIFAVYSSFLQRAYDQILHDVCIQNLPVVFAIDRAGLVGSDGETHQGIFDISYLSSIPNMTITAPKNKWELSDMIKYAVNFGTPVAVRYPRGEAYDGLKEYRAPISIGKCEWIYRESGIALFALGSMVKTAVAVRDALKAEGYPCSIINARFAKPLDEDALRYITEHHKVIVTMEENVISGGFGEHVTEFYNNENCKDIRIVNIAIPDEYVEHGNVELLRKEVGLDADTIIARTIEAYQNVTE